MVLILTKYISKIILSFSRFIKNKSFDLIIVLGDTNSTAAVSIAAKSRNLPLIHIEAGERTYFHKDCPEELNRLISDQCADLLFTCSKEAKLNLLNEGYSSKKIKFIGDPMLDLFKYFSNKLKLNKEFIILITLMQHYIEKKIRKMIS